MLSTKATTLLLVAIIDVSFADPLKDRRSNYNPSSESMHYQNPSDQNSINTASQYGQNSGYQNPPAGKQQIDRQSYPREPIFAGSALNLTFVKPFPETKPFEETLDIKMIHDSIDNQHPAGSNGQKNFLGSVTVQKGNTYWVDPNSTNFYGSITSISGMHLSPSEQEQIDRIAQQSLSSDDSKPKSYQTSDGKTYNVNGAVTYQTNTNYPPQSQQSIQQSTESCQPTSAQPLPQKSLEAQQLRYLRMDVSKLTAEVQRQGAKLNQTLSTLNTIEELVRRMDNMVYRFIVKT